MSSAQSAMGIVWPVVLAVGLLVVLPQAVGIAIGRLERRGDSPALYRVAAVTVAPVLFLVVGRWLEMAPWVLEAPFGDGGHIGYLSVQSMPVTGMLFHLGLALLIQFGLALAARKARPA